MVSEPRRRVPAEWEPHAACWTAWPTHRYAWGEALQPAQRQAAAFMQAIAQQPGSERLRVLHAELDGEPMARAAAGLVCETIDDIAYGDVWLRDTGPVFVQEGARQLAVDFGFDGWGGKYLYPHDAEVAAAVALRAGIEVQAEPFVLEGGALECDGQGTLLTTRSCLLDAIRNPGAQLPDVEAMLAARLGAQRVLWLDHGLAGDHTDGHIDNIARFVGPAAVVCGRATDDDDPNTEVLQAIEAQLRVSRDAADRPLEVFTLPSAGLVVDADGAPMPASYLNFYIGNAVVIVPAFGRPTDAQAAEVLDTCFPTRRVLSLPADALLLGGGTFHCMSRQQPAQQAHATDG